VQFCTVMRLGLAAVMLRWQVAVQADVAGYDFSSHSYHWLYRIQIVPAFSSGHVPNW
jgi:hypothetical protein